MNPISTLRFILDHPLNRGQPIGAIARYLGWQIRSRLQEEVIVAWIEGTKLAARSGMTGATGNIYCGLHEFADMAFVLHALRPGDLFVDVGANIGSYSILASGVAGAHSVAIEPDPRTAKNLARNVEVNRLADEVEIVEAAVGAEEGTITFTTGKDTMNRVATGADVDVQTVPLKRLDEILENYKPTLAKFDVEGYETKALLGAEQTLAQSSLSAVLLETVDDEALGILERHRFKKFGYSPERRQLMEDDLGNGANLLFVRDAELLQQRLSSSPARNFRGHLI